MSEEQEDLIMSIAGKYQQYTCQPLTDLAEHHPEVFHLMCKEIFLRVGDIHD